MAAAAGTTASLLFISAMNSNMSTSGFSSNLTASAFTIFIVSVGAFDGEVLDLPDAGSDSAEIWSSGSSSTVALMHWSDGSDYTALDATQAPEGTGSGQIIETDMGYRCLRHGYLRKWS